MKLRAILCTVAFALAARAGLAQDKLSLLDAVNAALAADPAAGISAADVDAALAARREAEAALRPHVDLAGSILRYEEPMVVTPIHGFTPGQFPEFDRTLIQSNVSATYLLYDGGAARARVRQLDASASAAAAGLDTARDAVAARTAALYLSVLSRAAVVSAHDSRINALDAELNRVRQLRAVGRAAEVEVLRVDAARAASVADRTAAAADLEVAEQALARSAGLPFDRTRAANLEPVRIDPGSFDRARLEQQVVENSPAVRQAQERLRAQQAAVALANAGNRPRVNAIGSLLEFGSGEGTFATEWNAGAQVRWSVFDGGATKQRVAQARAGVERAENAVRLAEKDAHDAVDRALAEYEQARATADSLAAAVERFQEVVRIERLRLDTGVGTQTDYLRAEADLLAARASLAASRYRSMIASIEVARLTGELSPEWLHGIIRSGS